VREGSFDMKYVMMAVLLGSVCALPSRSLAQQTGGAGGASAVPAPPPEEPPLDGVRFRGGISAAGGGEFVSNYAFGMGGIEGRLGVQINHLIGVYAAPYLAFGAGSVGSGLSAFTGTAGVSAIVDFTIADQFFVGAGGGFGVLNNPTGPAIHLRVGGYPAMGFGANGYRRRGLVVGLDARLFLLDDGLNGIVPVMQIMAGVGYEAF
jgi:hypothetical protein